MFRSCGEVEVLDGGGVVAAEVVFLAVALLVVAHIVGEVSVDDDGAELEDGLGAVGGPSGSGDPESFQQSLSGREGAGRREGACVVGVCFGQRLDERRIHLCSTSW